MNKIVPGSLFSLLSTMFLFLLGSSPAKSETIATMYLMTTSSSANVTTLHVINSSETAQSFTGTLYNADGERLGDADVALHIGTVAPRQRITLNASDLEMLFGASPWKGPAMLDVKGETGFELMAKLRSPSGLISNTNCVTEGKVHNIEGFDSTALTFVRFINSLDIAMGRVKGTLYDADGNTIGTDDRDLLTGLAAKEQIWINRNQLSDIFGATWNGEATLEVEDASGLKLLNLNFVNNETFFNFSCFETASAFVETESIPSELVGSWTGQDFTGKFMFLADGSFYAIRWDDDEGANGIEAGTFATSGGTFVTDVTVNDDGDGLTCGDENREPCVGTLSFSVAGDVLNINNEAMLDRDSLPGTGLSGLWKVRDQDPALFLFQEDGTYFGMQVVESNGFVGFERGTYVVSGSTLIFDVLDNNDGEALICGESEGVTCSGETVTFSVTGDVLTAFGDIIFDRQL